MKDCKQEELLLQLDNIDYSKVSNSLESGISPELEAQKKILLAQSAEKVHQYFKKDEVRGITDELGDTIMRMFSAKPERGAMVLDIVIFIFISDDLLEKPKMKNNPEKFRELHTLVLQIIRNEVIKEEYSEWENLIKYAQPIFRKFQAMVTSTLFHRFTYEYQEYLEGVAWESSINSFKQVFDWETCKNLKRYVSGWFVVFVLMEFAHDIEVPISVRSHVAIDRFCTLACDIGYHDNEARDGVFANSVLFLYSTGAEKTLQSAVDKISLLRNQAESELKTIAHNLPSFGSDDEVANKYIKAIMNAIGANYEWCRATKRYHNKNK